MGRQKPVQFDRDPVTGLGQRLAIARIHHGQNGIRPMANVPFADPEADYESAGTSNLKCC